MVGTVVQVVGGGPFIDGVEKPAELQISQLTLVAQRARELRPAIVDACEAADQFHAHAREGIEVEGGPIFRAGELHRRDAAGSDDVIHFVVALVEHARCFHPPMNVPAPVQPRPTHVLAHGEDDFSAGPSDLGSDLHAGCRRPDHHDATLAELVGVAVLHGS